VVAGPSIRRRSGLITELPYIGVLVLAALGVGYALADSHHWLRGVGLAGAALLLAGLLRLTLPDTRAGLLAVRNRYFDALCYLALGGVIVGVGLVLPH
jgi:hypothetical protein